MDQLRPFANPTIAGAVVTGLRAALSQPLALGWAAAPLPHPSVSHLGADGLAPYPPTCFAAGLLCQAPGFWHYAVGLVVLGAATVVAFGLGLLASVVIACRVLG